MSNTLDYQNIESVHVDDNVLKTKKLDFKINFKRC